MRFRMWKVCLAVAACVGAMFVGLGPAAASHYVGGDYGVCQTPGDTNYDGVHIEGQGIGSDKPYNGYVQALGIVNSYNKCNRNNAKFHVLRVQIDKIAVRWNNTNYHTAGPFNNGSNSVRGTSGLAAPPCGTYVQAAFRWSVRYSNNALYQGYLNSAGFRALLIATVRCSRAPAREHRTRAAQ